MYFNIHVITSFWRGKISIWATCPKINWAFDPKQYRTENES